MGLGGMVPGAAGAVVTFEFRALEVEWPQETRARLTSADAKIFMSLKVAAIGLAANRAAGRIFIYCPV